MGCGRQRDNQINKHSDGQAASQTHICAIGILHITGGEIVYAACLTLLSLITLLTLRFILAAQIPAILVMSCCLGCFLEGFFGHCQT